MQMVDQMNRRVNNSACSIIGANARARRQIGASHFRVVVGYFRFQFRIGNDDPPVPFQVPTDWGVPGYLDAI